MIPVTAAVTLLGIIAVLTVRPGRALGVVVMAMLLYPDYLRVPMGLAQMSASRMVAMALLARMLVRVERSEFRWCLADSLVITIYLWSLLANFMTDSGSERMVWSIGNGLDTALIYFCARLTLSRIEHRRDALLPLCLVLIWLGSVGVVESLTGWSPYQPLLRFNSWQWMDKGLEYRMGLVRARGSTSHPIYFGVSLFCTTVLAASFASLKPKSWFTIVAIALGVLGACSSLSSGPQLSLTIFVLVGLFYFRPEYIKPALYIALGMGILAEILSDRRFYYLIDYLNFSGGTSYYRNRLIEVAVRHLPEYWIFGYGSEWPNHWGAQIDQRRVVDIVNHYVILAVYGGAIPAVCYLAVQALGIREAVGTWRVAGTRTRRMAFLQSGGLLGVMLGSLAVSLFAPAVGLVYILMATMVRQPLDDPEAYDED